MIKYEVKMTNIGKDAPTYLESNSSFILMNEKIRPTLTDMVVEHSVSEVTQGRQERFRGCLCR